MPIWKHDEKLSAFDESNTPAGEMDEEDAQPTETIQVHHAHAPAKLPEYSRAAAAQRLSQMPEKASVGVSYAATHRPLHPPGWRLKRHVKRRYLRLTNLSYQLTDRAGIRWAILPIGIGTLLFIVVTTTLLMTFIASSNATDQRYHSQVTTLADILPRDSLRMYDASGNLIYQATDQGDQISEPLDKISPNLQKAEIDIEDQTFWQNNGYDITGIVRAALSNLSSGHVVSGGSTITQQLIKNAIVGSSDTAVRKLEEIELAPEVTRIYTKQQILDMYLNTTYYANNAYGAEAAARIYFGLQDQPNNPASNQLDIAQAATLAGIPSNPSMRNPIAYPQNSIMRTQEVLHQMLVLKSINTQQYTQALEEIQKPGFASYHPFSNVTSVALSSFTNYTLGALATNLHVKISDLSRSGLTVSTTVNSGLQAAVLQDAQQNVAALSAHHVNDSSVVMINPKTGAIEVLVGNVDPAHNQFDVATQGFRQAGSSMKAFTYATAFENGLSPGMKTFDEPQTFYYNGIAYRPDNYGGVHHGLISYRQALDWSLNIDAVRLEMSPYVGVQQDYDKAEKFGLGQTNGTVNETFTLGSLGVHLLNETSAYGTFATGGIHVPPHAINVVTDDGTGKVVYQAPTTGQREISAQAAYILTNVLADNAVRDQEFFPCDSLDLNTGSQCRGTVIPAAVKTGTSNDFADNLTVGYTPSLVTGVWTGNDDNSPMNNVIGITGAGPIWHDAMMMALQGQPIEHFTDPGGVIFNPAYGDLIKG